MEAGLQFNSNYEMKKFNILLYGCGQIGFRYLQGLLKCKENINIYTCNIDQGIGVIQNKKNTEVLKLEKKLNKLKFKDFYYNYKKYMRMISLEEFKKIF